MRLEPWWPRWISIDWGFQHPSAVYGHCAVPCPAAATGVAPGAVAQAFRPEAFSLGGSDSAREQKTLAPEGASYSRTSRIVTYREFVQSGLSPRMLAQGIAERSGRERISEVFLSPDAFAHRTAEASIAEQLGDVLVANGLPRPCAADDDRIGGWQLMYQLLESDSWLITENCAKLIDGLPQLVRDTNRVEDIRKMDGDDAADAARYGLVSGARLANLNGVGAGLGPPGSIAGPGQREFGNPARFVTGMPLGEQIARQVTAQDATSRAIHYQRLESEAHKQFRPAKLPRRRG